MSSIFLACLGGSGSKVLEAVTHMAAMDLWAGASIHVLVVDVDGGNGNQQRAAQAVAQYEKIRKMEISRRLFRSPILLYTWTPTPGSDNLLTMEAGDKSEKSALLSRHLFSQDEREMTVDKGFKGHPNIGVLFMQSIMAAYESCPGDGLADFIQAANESDANRLLVVGSCYGGTGASCIPIIGQYLRTRLDDRFALGLLAILPTFSLKKTSKQPIDPDSNEFTNRVKTVLSTYISEEILKYKSPNAVEPVPMYEKIYLLGSPELIPFLHYAPGRNLQENPATFFDWFSCSAVSDYFGQGDPKSLGIYTAWLKQGPWDWDLFSQDLFTNLKPNATELMIAVGLFMAELHRPMREMSKAGVNMRKNPLELYFADLSSANSASLSTDLDTFAEYGAMLVLWFYQIVTTLPQHLFPDMGVGRHRISLTPEKMEQKLDKHGIELDESDKRNLYLLYYQKFFSAPALLRMEKMRQDYWPRGHEYGTHQSEENYLEAYQQIFRDQWGNDEEKSLGVLLPRVTNSNHYPGATSDKLMGEIFAATPRADDDEYPARPLLRQMFRTIDAIVRS